MNWMSLPGIQSEVISGSGRIKGKFQNGFNNNPIQLLNFFSKINRFFTEQMNIPQLSEGTLRLEAYLFRNGRDYNACS